ncbi:hypothetical protein DERP_008998 [Dermatophagoides pteronyssinus]|uniref:Uncharacterized protein n=1 Tax=Dermatophagoides pteronyssinus TaxID=6956 RepID=A0ABQ8JG49_DERPT|nr:hypothetical protein DERP_008998 [Dermatophagoides pteronyssinus]
MDDNIAVVVGEKNTPRKAILILALVLELGKNKPRIRNPIRRYNIVTLNIIITTTTKQPEKSKLN